MHKKDIDFIPLAIESFGGWGTLAIDAINTMSRRIADLKGLDRNDTRLQIYQRLSVMLQRMNASMWLDRKYDTIEMN
ncbi:MAG: hypothetical protein GY938_04055 [Ketobacter sp.]|nr:hypothetical protein [Ketobacter sp.]